MKVESVEAKAPKPAELRYRTICISMYAADMENLDAMVAELKKRGVTTANRSGLIRLALSRIDLDVDRGEIGMFFSDENRAKRGRRGVRDGR